MAPRYDKSQPLRALSQSLTGVGEAITSYANQKYKLQTAQEYNKARINMMRSTNQFLTALEQDPDYKSFETKFEEFQQSAYPVVTMGMESTDAKNQFEMDWGLQMESLRSDVQQLSLRRGRTIARGQLVTDIQEVIDLPAAGMWANDEAVYDNAGNPIDKRAAYIQTQKERIRSLLDAGAVGGYLSPEEHSAMMEKYIPMFEKNWALQEALKLVRSGMSQEEVEKLIHEQDYVDLGPEFTETLIARVRNEDNYLKNRDARIANEKDAAAYQSVIVAWSADPDNFDRDSIDAVEGLSFESKQALRDVFDGREAARVARDAEAQKADLYLAAELGELSATEVFTDARFDLLDNETKRKSAARSEQRRKELAATAEERQFDPFKQDAQFADVSQNIDLVKIGVTDIDESSLRSMLTDIYSKEKYSDLSSEQRRSLGEELVSAFKERNSADNPVDADITDEEAILEYYRKLFDENTTANEMMYFLKSRLGIGKNGGIGIGEIGPLWDKASKRWPTFGMDSTGEVNYGQQQAFEALDEAVEFAISGYDKQKQLEKIGAVRRQGVAIMEQFNRAIATGDYPTPLEQFNLMNDLLTPLREMSAKEMLQNAPRVDPVQKAVEEGSIPEDSVGAFNTNLTIVNEKVEGNIQGQQPTAAELAEKSDVVDTRVIDGQAEMFLFQKADGTWVAPSSEREKMGAEWKKVIKKGTTWQILQ